MLKQVEFEYFLGDNKLKVLADVHTAYVELVDINLVDSSDDVTAFDPDGVYVAGGKSLITELEDAAVDCSTDMHSYGTAAE